MSASVLAANAALVLAAILLPSLVQLARQGKSIDEYYDEETYYDEKAVDGSADFSEDLTYAQYDLGTVTSTEKSASQIHSTVTTTRPGSRRIHVAKQQDVPTSKTTRRAATATTDGGLSRQLPPPRANITGMCRVVRSEAWRQVNLYAECLEISDVKNTDRRLGEMRFLRQFRLASQTTDLLWRYLLPKIDSKGYNLLQKNRADGFCSHNMEKAKQAIRLLDDDPLPGEPAHGWEMVCRLVKEYKYCVRQLMAGCQGIPTEVSRKETVKVRAAAPATYCFVSCASSLAAATMWAVVTGIVALWSQAPWLP